MATITSSSNINNIIALLVLLAILLAARKGAGQTSSLVPLACTAAYAAGGSSFTVDFCMSALNSDGQSASATKYSELVLIAVDLVTANATATEVKIDALLAGHGGGGTAVAEGLQSCRGLYDAVVRLYQPDCQAAVRDRRLGDARSCLGRSVQAAGDCERGFNQRNVASPVAREDDDLAKLANLAIALTTIY